MKKNPLSKNKMSLFNSINHKLPSISNKKYSTIEDLKTDLKKILCSVDEVDITKVLTSSDLTDLVFIRINEIWSLAKEINKNCDLSIGKDDESLKDINENCVSSLEKDVESLKDINENCASSLERDDESLKDINGNCGSSSLEIDDESLKDILETCQMIAEMENPKTNDKEEVEEAIKIFQTQQLLFIQQLVEQIRNYLHPLQSSLKFD